MNENFDTFLCNIHPEEVYKDGDEYMDFLYHLPELMAEPVLLKDFNNGLKRILCQNRLYGYLYIERVAWDSSSVSYNIFTLQEDNRHTVQDKTFAAYLYEQIKAYLESLGAVHTVYDDAFSVIVAKRKKTYHCTREKYYLDLKTPTGKIISATIYIEPEGLASYPFYLFNMTECKDLHDEIYGRGD